MSEVDLEPDSGEHVANMIAHGLSPNAVQAVILMSLATSMKRIADAICGTPTCTGIHEIMCCRGDDNVPF